MQTASGREVNLATLAADDVSLVDVATHLAKINRFGGATRQPYSVAEHSVHVARTLATHGHGPALQLLGLLHDAAEAYLGDVIYPVQLLARHEAPVAALWLERTHARVQAVIESALLPEAAVALLDGGLDRTLRAHIKRADLVLLATERRDLLAHTATRWAVLEGIEPLPRRFDAVAKGLASPLKCWDHVTAELMFVETFRALRAACQRSARHA